MSIPSSTLERLKKLKEVKKQEAEENNLSCRSTSYNSTPLSTFLLLYSKASRECYINYMQGAKALAYYLAPIKLPTLESCTYKTLPPLVSSYDLREIAKILSPDNTLKSIYNTQIIIFNCLLTIEEFKL